ncbi:TetR/AcrR family transcriptional regulator [Terrarubrum flagellatum]|uniref:TetR/AcrR family transcriptional regulator n=1 Tax=Terrirubrum flagellatum TaxID=2895980 RepID=UPI003145380D
MKLARPRGRPRAYDPEKALGDIRDVFWRHGYSATSLDDLSAATGMNRPSLYGAFGAKEDLYLKALDRYRAEGVAAMMAALDPKLSLREGLARVYETALSMYLPDKGAARGCLLIGTAAVEAMSDEKVRRVLGDSLRDFDQEFEKRFRAARKSGEIARDSDPVLLAKFASAVLHTLALRSRAGDARKELEKTAKAGIEMLCGK